MAIDPDHTTSSPPPEQADALAAGLEAAEDVAITTHVQVDRRDHDHDAPPEAPADLTAVERELLADLFAIVEEHAAEVARPVDRRRLHARSDEPPAELQ
jgi:hypothetical protein